MNKEFLEVKEFHAAFGHPHSDVPVSMTSDRAKKRYAWILEEINEFLDAVKAEDIVEQADAMIDTIYFALGTLVEMGVQPDELFRIVQHANMSKLWADGKPHYNEMGKVIKPDGWENPHPKLQEAVNLMENSLTIDKTKEDYMIDYQYEEVKEFHTAFGHPHSDVPVSMTSDRAKKRYAWILEEINEFLDAVKAEDIVEQADAMIDTIYFALGTLVEMGVQPDELFRIVQHANMSKLWADGKPHYNEMGKVIKPDGWENPHPKLQKAIAEMSKSR